MRICGLDEVGRGPLAGPLVGAATILKSQIPNLNDSKKLTVKQREEIYKWIIDSGSEVHVEMISARQINNRGIGWANREVFRKLIKRIEADKYVVDGNLKIRGAESVIKADAKIPEAMAASIIAKVTRDRMMKELAQKHDKYDWKNNVGYGTKKHIQAIKEHGVTIHHRSVFVRTALSRRVIQVGITQD